VGSDLGRNAASRVRVQDRALNDGAARGTLGGVRRALLLLFALSLTGCFLDRSGTRTMGGQDAGPGGLDAGRPDAGPPVEPDAGDCAPGLVGCPPTGCVDPQTDPAHCGGCGIFCPIPANGAAVCAGGACSATCDPGFVDVGGECVEDTACGDRALNPGEACDDGDRDPGDGCGPDCRLEMVAPDRCPGAPIELETGLQIYTGSTRDASDFLRCGPGGNTAQGPDAVYTVEPTFSGPLRIRVRPIGGWDITLDWRPECPITPGDSFTCGDLEPSGMAEEIRVEVNAGSRYTVAVSGWRSSDFGEFRLELEGG